VTAIPGTIRVFMFSYLLGAWVITIAASAP
jgi:hypothetical protein